VNLQQALAYARKRLVDHPDIDAFLESEVLLRYVLKITRTQLHLDYSKALSPDQEKTFENLLERLLIGEPLAYITRCREFFGLDFYVDKRVLIPRPESEHLVETALEYSQNHRVSSLADIGTGSGAIAVCLAKNLPQVKIYATDISNDALEVARTNCQKHAVSDRIILLQGDLLKPIPEPVDIIIANLPYVKKADLSRMPSAKYEPVSALDGGKEGLDWIFRLGRQLEGKLTPEGCLLLEIGLGQSESVTAFFHGLFPSASTESKSDLAGIDRIIKLSFVTPS
jgi:release factor glutamine methyltransferase